MVTASEINGMYAIIPTPANPGAERWDAVDTVNVPETERLVDALINDGSDGIIALGTTGECATLTPAEFRTVAEAVVRAARGRVPVFVGATALGLHEVVARMRVLREIGADGTLLGLPMWQPCTDQMAVEYYAAVSEAFPDLAVMVYGNSRAFRYDFGVPFWTGIAKSAPTVVAMKASAPVDLLEKQRVTDGRVNFLPNEGVIAKFHELAPDRTTACWATAASMGPGPAIAMTRAVRAHDAAEIERLARELAHVGEPVKPILSDPAIFASYNIQMEKIRIKEAGYCDPGPIRPPYNVMPEDYAERSRECGRRWAALRDRMASGVTA